MNQKFNHTNMKMVKHQKQKLELSHKPPSTQPLSKICMNNTKLMQVIDQQFFELIMKKKKQVLSFSFPLLRQDVLKNKIHLQFGVLDEMLYNLEQTENLYKIQTKYIEKQMQATKHQFNISNLMLIVNAQCFE